MDGSQCTAAGFRLAADGSTHLWRVADLTFRGVAGDSTDVPGDGVPAFNTACDLVDPSRPPR